MYDTVKLQINEESGMAVWPTDWPRRYLINEPCDMAVGPCACGAWHQLSDYGKEKA